MLIYLFNDEINHGKTTTKTHNVTSNVVLWEDRVLEYTANLYIRTYSMIKSSMAKQQEQPQQQQTTQRNIQRCIMGGQCFRVHRKPIHSTFNTIL